MIRRCCQDFSCKKIKPIAYSGRPVHKIGEIPTGEPGFNFDEFSNSGEIFNINYTERRDNVFSYKVTGDNKNVYHSCGTDGIHVYSLKSFYQNNNLSSRWKIGSSSEEGVSTDIKQFNYGEEKFGYRVVGLLNESEGSSTSFRYGYEPVPFSGFYDCCISGMHLVAARGSSGITIYKFNSKEKSDAQKISSVSVPGICKNVNCLRVGDNLIIFVGCARYEKPTDGGSDSDAFDIPSAPFKDFSDPRSIQELAQLGGWSVPQYEYAMRNGYESESADGFSGITSQGENSLRCLVYNIKEERWVLKKSQEKEKEISNEFSELLTHTIFSREGRGEVSSVSPLRLEGENVLVNYGVCFPNALGLPEGFEQSHNLSIAKTKEENGQGKEVSVFDLSSVLVEKLEGDGAILSVRHWRDTKFSTSYFDGNQGSQNSLGVKNGQLLVESSLGKGVYNIRSIEYDYYSPWGWTYTTGYSLNAEYKSDMMECFISRGKMILSVFEGGVLIPCAKEGESILDWIHFDSHSSFQGGDSYRTMVSTLGNKCPSTLSIIDSWSDGKTVFSVDCMQNSIMGGPRSLGLYYFPSNEAGKGSPEVLDTRRSYTYRRKSESSLQSASGGGLIALSFGD